MIPKECKRLAEVDFPIAVVSKHSAREKSIRHGHPSTLHLWWARRPLAACRAMLLALLWPDPCHPNCPQEFKERAREVLAPLPGKVGTTDEDLRKALLKFIGDFADWDRSTDPVYLEASRALVKAGIWRRGTTGSGPLCRWRFDTPGSAEGWLRGVCERSQSCGVFDTEGYAGRYSATRTESISGVKKSGGRVESCGRKGAIRILSFG